MGEILYFKNEEAREHAEKLLNNSWPEAAFVVMRIGSKSLFVEERIHFGKWDIDVENEKVFYKNEELEISETQWEILAFLMSGEGICFSEPEIAYALDLKESEIQICIADLLKKIETQTGSLIIRKVGERYLFEEVID